MRYMRMVWKKKGEKTRPQQRSPNESKPRDRHGEMQMRWTFDNQESLKDREERNSNNERRRRSVVNVKSIRSILEGNLEEKKQREEHPKVKPRKEKKRYEPGLCK
jgi:hypothetical protein